jgi:hypothetical protein
MHGTSVSKDRIKEYLATLLAPQGGKSIKNYAGYERAIESIPYGIPGGDVWLTASFTIRHEIAGRPSHVRTAYYRPIKACLEFLPGFQPFKDDLVGEPEQITLGERRVYGEMNSGDWWWHMQSEIEEGGTVVPVIIATDKTLMTQ